MQMSSQISSGSCKFAIHPFPLVFLSCTSLTLTHHLYSYIHGGAWRDPLITSRSLIPTLRRLGHTQYPSITGFASLNYRLSPYPSHPTLPSDPTDPSRNVRHPDHVCDVRRGIRHLQKTYGFSNRYALFGHSCGATLAYQAMNGDDIGTQQDRTPRLEPPIAIVGIAGIYDIPALVARHENIPAYKEFVTSAFGVEPATWRQASPMVGADDTAWPWGVRFVGLCRSRADELVEMSQTELMYRSLQRKSGRSKRLRMLEIEGSHDDCWETGEGLTKAIEMLVKAVQELDTQPDLEATEKEDAFSI